MPRLPPLFLLCVAACAACAVCAAGPAPAAAAASAASGKALQDYVMDVKHALGKANMALGDGKLDAVLAHIDSMQEVVQAWRAAVVQRQTEAHTPPAEDHSFDLGTEFSINVTHLPEKCEQRSKAGDTVRVQFVGKVLATGKIFDSSFHTGSAGHKVTIGLAPVAGWNDGLDGMCIGERRTLLIPAHLAFGAEGRPPKLPPHADVKYFVELLKISKSSSKASTKSEL